MARQTLSKGKIFLILITTTVMITGFSAFSFAGYGGCPAGGAGYGKQGRMTDAQIEAFQEQRAAFFNKTKEIRRELKRNHALMRAEMAAKELDTAKLAAIQNEISALKAKLAEERLTHIIEMKKNNPDFDPSSCPMGGYEKEAEAAITWAADGNKTISSVSPATIQLSNSK